MAESPRAPRAAEEQDVSSAATAPNLHSKRGREKETNLDSAPRIMHLMQFAFGMTAEDGPSLQPIFAGVDPHCH